MAEDNENKDEQNSDLELDNILNDLISEDTKTQEDSGETLSNSGEELELNKMADDPTNESSDSVEEEEEVVEAKEVKEAEEVVEEPKKEEPAEDMSYEDMWAAAFAGQEGTEQAASEKKTEETEEDDDAAELGISEDDYPEDDDEEKIKIGPISVLATQTGKMMLAGGVLGILLTAGGVYFAMQTFAPPELAEVEKSEAEIPKGLTPKKGEGAMTASVEEPATPSKSSTDETKKPNVPGMTKEGTKSEVTQELNKSDTLSETAKEVEVVEEDSAGLQAALSPEAKMVKLATIMPVAFDVNDIRVLSFTLEITFDNEAGAKVLSSALPIFEEITVLTVENFLKRKFYNDILYVKEKLQKRLKLAYNNKIEGGTRVKKIKFEDFLIQ